MSEEVDVLVCGAGVGGLATAAAIGALGATVLLVDKLTRRPPIAKGELLQPGALSSLREWGAEEILLRQGACALDRLSIRAPDGESLLALDYAAVLGPKERLLAADHQTILDALEATLPGNVTIRRGVRVDRLIRDSAGRVAGAHIQQPGGETAVRARLVVAADGIGSKLRAEAEMGGKRAEYAHRLLSFEVAGEYAGELSAYVTERGLRLVYPLPGGTTRVYTQVGPDELRGIGHVGLVGWTHRMVDGVPALDPMRDGLVAALAGRQLLPVPRFLAPSLAKPGLALVGESAHAVHPMAAQGMNTAITDAAALADRLRAVGGFAAADVDEALRSYQRERMPMLEHIATVSHNAARMITDVSPLGRLLGRTLMRNTARNPRLLAATCHNMAGVDVRPLRLTDRFYQLGLLRDANAQVIAR
ncbi:FAD-dependent oxidoreductase [Amycolatopsis sp. cg5]|uniref:FAD-dependent oxidoreductase n=1 Tax=Amycolatopsis sp. cg5 TaxID=3238802 RepID=UPI0035239785